MRLVFGLDAEWAGTSTSDGGMWFQEINSGIFFKLKIYCALTVSFFTGFEVFGFDTSSEWIWSNP